MLTDSMLMEILFVWGDFHSANNQAARGFAIMHPASKSLASGHQLAFKYSVNGSAFNSTLYLSGSFTSDSGIHSRLVTYTHGVWQMKPACAIGIDTTCTLAQLNNELYAASGNFAQSFGKVTRWDGKKWVSLIDSVQELVSVRVIATHCGLVQVHMPYICMESSTAYMYRTRDGSLHLVFIKYDGQSWHALSSEMSSALQCSCRRLAATVQESGLEVP